MLKERHQEGVMRKTKWISRLGCLGLCVSLMSQPVLLSFAEGSTAGGSSLAGISTVLDDYFNKSEKAEESITEFVTTETKARGISVYNNLAISKVEEYVNVRKGPSTEDDIMGKIYDQCGATILSTTTQEDGDWYHILSGNVDGYVKAEFFVTGLEARDYAKANGNMYLQINVDGINIRKEANTDCDILTVLSDGKDCRVIGEEGNFWQVRLKDGKTGYASKEFTDVYIHCDTAITLEEEKAIQEELARQAREEAERRERERLAAEKASREAAEAAWLEYVRESEAQREAEEAAWLAYVRESEAQREAEEAAWAAYVAEQEAQAAWEAEQARLAAEQAAWEQVEWEEDPVDDGQYYEPIYSNNAARNAIVEYCYSKLGCDYVWAAEGPYAFDCSGLVKKAYEQVGISLIHQSGYQGREGVYTSLENAQPGDILWKQGHVGIYVGNGLCIHASTYGVGVIVSGLYDVGWDHARNLLG